ncbi:hypothetical protein BJ508DRAFT_413905 [Ascobolus immersus RN42]|uniref:Uncharacterized protein n=1 Tax=Ascobolus immersus RN42 TaxID=1160509 RepID=A0A3N4IEV6_ASCIM|nr:hypothetical protein BJ508DRAFT_413905 [Ascobolus immersus RN42]
MHPRSFFTTSLFTTTALLSFAVVSIPHVLPCPAPKVVMTEAVDKKDDVVATKECPIPKPLKIAEKIGIVGGSGEVREFDVKRKVEVISERR